MRFVVGLGIIVQVKESSRCKTLRVLR